MRYYLILYVFIGEYSIIAIKVVKLEMSWPFNCLDFVSFLVTVAFTKRLESLFGHFPKIFLDFVIKFINNIWILVFLNLIPYV